jgi:hypothetical protein
MARIDYVVSLGPRGQLLRGGLASGYLSDGIGHVYTAVLSSSQSQTGRIVVAVLTDEL